MLGRNRTDTRVDTGWAVKQGLIGGIIAGIIFAMFEMVIAWLLSGNFFGPLRMIAGIPLQQPPPQIAMGTAIVVGMITHMVFSMMFGVVVAWIVAMVAALRRSPAATVAFATLFGLVLWPLNFFVIAPLINAPWFMTEPSQLWQGFVAHTFMYGTVLGLYLARQLPGAATTGGDVPRA